MGFSSHIFSLTKGTELELEVPYASSLGSQDDFACESPKKSFIPLPTAHIAHSRHSDSPLRDGGTIGIALHAIKPDFRSPEPTLW